MISGFRLEQSFHSSCGGAGNFSLLVQRKVTKRKHVAWRPRFYAGIFGTVAQIPIACSSRQLNGLPQRSIRSQDLTLSYCLTPSPTSSDQRRCFSRYYLPAASVRRLSLVAGTVRAIADSQEANLLASCHVLSFLVTSFFTRVLRRRSGANSGAGRVAVEGRMPGVKKEVTRSSAGGVEALLSRSRNKKELDSRLCGNDEDIRSEAS